jgi:hypothetical protein
MERSEHAAIKIEATAPQSIPAGAAPPAANGWWLFCALVLAALKQRSCAPGRTRTFDLRIRNPLLYPAELRAHLLGKMHRLTDFGCIFHGHVLRSTL